MNKKEMDLAHAKDAIHRKKFLFLFNYYAGLSNATGKNNANIGP